MTDIDFGKCFKLLRKQSGFHQREVATALGLEQSAISKIEAGLRELKPIEIKICAELFQVPVSSFFEEVTEIPEALLANSKTGVKGIYRDKSKFKAEIRVNGKQVCLGRFNSVEEAKRALALHRGESEQQKPEPIFDYNLLPFSC